jgi:hypothetical protein
MTPEMIELSKKNAAKGNVKNVEFHLASMDASHYPTRRRTW